MNKKILLVLLPFLPVLLAGCAGLKKMSNSISTGIGGQLSRSKISIQNGVATCDYTVSYDRAVLATESALRSYDITLTDPMRGPASYSAKGTLKDGRAVEVTVTPVSTLSRVAVRVGAEDTNRNRDDAKAIHYRIDDDCQVVRRTYNTGFDPVWQAGQKVVPPDERIQPDNTLGQMKGKRDGTPVVMTIQRTEDGRTRITIEVGSSANPQSREDAVKLAKAISEALGLKAEEDP